MTRDWEDSVNIEMDITTRCDVGCISCARINPYMFEHHNNVWRRLFTEDFLDLNVETITFTSKWGDPLAHPDFMEMLDVLYDNIPDCTVSIESSLAYHDEDYYRALGKSLRRFPDSRVSTCVYGTGDLHQKFRTGSDFETVERHTKTLARMRVFVFWHFVVFNYNQDDLDNVLSHAVNCRVGGLATREFWNEKIYVQKTADGLESQPEWLQYPNDYEPLTEDWGHKPFPEPNMNEEFADGEECNSLRNRSIWIDAWGGVWPCYAIGKNSMELQHPEGTEIERVFDIHGRFNNVNTKKLREILQHTWFKEILPQRQETKPYVACKKECNLCDR